MIFLYPRALEDIADLAQDYQDGLRDTFQLIERFRGIGHPVARHPDLRAYRHKWHKIYYMSQGDDLFIVRVLHEKRRVPQRIRGN